MRAVFAAAILALAATVRVVPGDCARARGLCSPGSTGGSTAAPRPTDRPPARRPLLVPRADRLTAGVTRWGVHSRRALGGAVCRASRVASAGKTAPRHFLALNKPRLPRFGTLPPQAKAQNECDNLNQQIQQVRNESVGCCLRARRVHCTGC
jgi:hypothetical protein